MWKSESNIYFQYFAIVKKFNVLGCNDQFFKIFLNVLIFNASFGIGLLNNAVPGKFGINYYICTGEDPQKYDFLEPKVNRLCPFKGYYNLKYTFLICFVILQNF